jgi:peptidoglycan/xylan/chitin deacetylase (PgdA/CDA1 family)
MLIVKKISKNLIFPIITGLGLEKILSKTSKNNNLILCFHGVSHFTSSMNKRHMDVGQFEALLIYIKKNFEVVSVQDIFTPAKSRKKRIAISFDDGYLNNYTVAFPLLKKHQLPAALYITTESFEINDYCLWPEIFDALRLGPLPEKIVFHGEEFQFENGLLIHVKSRISIYDYVKNMGEERQEAFDEFITTYNVKQLLKNTDPELRSFCTKEQVREMAQSPLIEIGSHTHRHYNLSRIDPELVMEELSKSKQILEEITQKPVVSIGYPDGDYSETVKNASEQLGYSHQLAVSFLSAKDYTDQRIRQRYSISNSTSLNVNKIMINQQFSKSGF